MIRIASVLLIVSVLGLAVFGVVTLYDETMQVGRMWETPRVMPHEIPMPVMADGSVPVAGGEALYHAADPAALQPPFNLADPAVVAAGQTAYGYYCIQCHGRFQDGYGTVGQSFAPPPADLRSLKVQKLPGGQMFLEISYGIPGGRQPALATTLSPDERWQVIGYIKSLGARR